MGQPNGFQWSRARWQWQPTLTNHDPSPPIALNDGGLASRNCTLAAIEASDIAAFSADSVVSSVLAATESQDVAAATVGNVVSCVLVSTEAIDTATITAKAIDSCALSVTEASDTANLAVDAIASLQLSVAEALDTAAASVDAIASLSVDATDTQDVADINVEAFPITEEEIFCELDAVELQDSVSFNITVETITPIRGHTKRRRGTYRLPYYEDIEKLEQEQIEEVAAKIAIQELDLEKEKNRLQGELMLEGIENKISLLKSDISDILVTIKELEFQKKQVMERLEFLHDEEDVEVLLLI